MNQDAPVEIPFAEVSRGGDAPAGCALHALLLQTAHRALSLTVWILAAKGVLLAWGRPMVLAVYLLPAACTLSLAGALGAVVVMRNGRDDARAEARELAVAGAIMGAAALAWMIISRNA